MFKGSDTRKDMFLVKLYKKSLSEFERNSIFFPYDVEHAACHNLFVHAQPRAFHWSWVCL